jgi:fatty acid desaturase
VSPEAWARAGKIRRAAYWANRTILFRMFVWTIVSTVTYLCSKILLMFRGNKQAWFAMAVHAAGLGVVVYLVCSVAGMPLWQFALGTTYGGRVLNEIRPFPEHKYRAGVETRTAMVMAGPFMSLLMLNNNLHVAHHEEPGVAWYEVPNMSARVNAVERAREAGLLYTDVVHSVNPVVRVVVVPRCYFTCLGFFDQHMLVKHARRLGGHEVKRGLGDRTMIAHLFEMRNSLPVDVIVEEATASTCRCVFVSPRSR